MQKRGKLNIFFGYCAGVGKTYAMLQVAQQKSVEGLDVVIGYIEPHERKETMDLIYGLEQLPLQEIKYKGRMLYEFSIDAALKRHPQLILVDELAHTNVPGSRHEKRYSDVEELLKAGIDVYTTINVQHLESLQDVVEGITKIKVNERIPDRIFDEADDVCLVDLEIEQLLERLKEGKIYPKQRIHQALDNFFLKDNLIALRSIALRRSAQRMDHVMAMQKRTFVKEHILVCISASVTNAKVIRTASRMAQAFQADFTALYVETQTSQHFTQKQLQRLQENLKLARHLNADIVSTYGNDVAYQISQYAKTSGVSKLVLGRSLQKKLAPFRKTIVDRLTEEAPDLDIFIIPDVSSETMNSHRHQSSLMQGSKQESLLTSIILILVTILSYLFYLIVPDITTVTLFFVLASCLIGFLTTAPIYGILTALYSILALNFLFIAPRFTFYMYSSRYVLVFVCLISVSLSISTLTRKLKMESSLASQHAHDMDVLLKFSQMLQRCSDERELMQEASKQLYHIFHRTILYYSIHQNTLQEPHFYDPCITEEKRQQFLDPAEMAVPKWVLKNNKNAGVSTSTLPNAKGLYLAIRKNNHIYAIVGFAMKPKEELPQYEKGLLKTILNEIALAYDSLD